MSGQEMIPQKSWFRAVARVNKIGYADGASEGKDAAFQSSFNLGYQQGIKFGLELGLIHSTQGLHQTSSQFELRDRRMINCQICINGTSTQQNTGNLYNLQQEKNFELLQNYRQS